MFRRLAPSAHRTRNLKLEVYCTRVTLDVHAFPQLTLDTRIKDRGVSFIFSVFVNVIRSFGSSDTSMMLCVWLGTNAPPPNCIGYGISINDHRHWYITRDCGTAQTTYSKLRTMPYRYKTLYHIDRTSFSYLSRSYYSHREQVTRACAHAVRVTIHSEEGEEELAWSRRVCGGLCFVQYVPSSGSCEARSIESPVGR